MKKTMVLLLVLAFVVTGCSNGQEANQPGTVSNSAGTNSESLSSEPRKVNISIMSWLADPVQGGIEKMDKSFMSDNPGVTVEYEAVTGDDYRTVYQTRFASGNAPDISMNAGYYWLELYGDKLASITNEAWAEYLPEASKQRWGYKGELYGFPINLQSISFIYNKDLFKQAGITDVPNTLTGLEDACAKLKAIGVTPFATCGTTTSKLAHSVNVAFGQQKDPLQFISEVRSGKTKIADNKTFQEWADFFDLTLKNSYGDVLTTDMDTVYSLFATGKVGIIQEGSWCEGSILKINPDIKMGIMPMPINDNAEGNIIAGDAADGFVITNNENTEISKKLVSYWALSDEGLSVFETYKMIPAMKNIKYDAASLGTLLKEADEYFKAGKYFGWYWYSFPDMTADMQLGSIMQEYIGGKVDKQGMLKEMDAKIAEIEAKSKSK